MSETIPQRRNPMRVQLRGSRAYALPPERVRSPARNRAVHSLRAVPMGTFSPAPHSAVTPDQWQATLDASQRSPAAPHPFLVMGVSAGGGHKGTNVQLRIRMTARRFR